MKKALRILLASCILICFSSVNVFGLSKGNEIRLVSVKRNSISKNPVENKSSAVTEFNIESDLLIENEIEDNSEESFSDNIHHSYSDLILFGSSVSIDQNNADCNRFISFNILYCVLRI